MRKTFSVFALIFAFLAAFAQENSRATHPSALYRSALDLFEKEKYTVSKKEFERYVQENSGLPTVGARYYIAYCALELGHEDEAETLFEEFLYNYPTHPKSDLVHYELGRYFYNKPDYENAIKHYELADLSKVSDADKNIAHFNLGYSYFITKKYEKAEPLFDKVKKYDSQYTYAANYYSGFIKYKKRNFEQAILDFKVAEQNASYETVVPFMLINIYYQQGKNDLVIEYGKEVLKAKKKIQKKNDVILLIADAHFKKKEYDKSAKLLGLFFKGKTKPDNTIRYRYAYSLMKIDEKDKAIIQFSEVASTEDSLGQYSAFYLGQLYLEKGNKNYAKNAFEQAAKADFDKDIQELSALNTAKLHFELKDFKKGLILSQEFVKKHPNSKYKKEVQELVTEGYLYNQNYTTALTYIEGLSSTTPRINKVYQQVAYLKAVDLYNQKNFGPSIQYFDKCLKFDFDLKVYNKALFWKAEALSILYQWKEANKTYDLLISTNDKGTFLYTKSRYSRGYTFYNQGQYAEAYHDFKEYIDIIESKNVRDHLDDALLRLADCYYYQKQWQNAVENYQKAISKEVKGKDYAYLKLGESKARTSDLDGALSSYDMVINNYPSSVYWSKALYEKAMLTYQNGKYALAIKEITRFTQAKPKDENIADLLMKRGISLMNVQRYEEALADFDLILEKYCQDKSLADDAFQLSRETLSKLNRENEIDKRLDLIVACNPDSSKLIEYKYDIALGFYNERKFEKAIGYFENFEKAYPNNDYKVELHYFMANCYYQLDRKKEAIDYYAKEVAYGRNKYYEISLLRLNKLLVNYEDQDQIIKYNKLLVKYASDVKHLLKAYVSLMDAYYEGENYDSSIYYASEILKQDNFVVDLKNKATLTKAKSLYMLEDSASVQVFADLFTSSSDAYGAEANYFLAKISREKGDYKKSQELAVNLKDQFSSYEYWVGKAFLLISENYIDLDEEFQAKSTLQSVIDYFPIPEIVEEAKTIMSSLENKETDEIQDSLNIEEEEY